MKNKIVFIICLLTVSCSLENNPKDEKVVRVLELLYPQVRSVLSEIYNETQNEYDWNKSVFVINIDKGKGSMYRLKITVLSQQELNWLIKDKGMYPSVFKNENESVFVFNDVSKIVFKDTNSTMKVEWLYVSDKVKTDIDEPPIIFEPEVWVYKFDSKSIEFESKGTYSFMD